ncbi:golgin subfamily A member 2-like isoform X2 [Erinaceus europaeus]|uniref:Golgin subfamily A member 2-like isoform X2 n=1 Tax=Erinaceus europaeus TaxID=9365 RepID=A0ABM3Y587_ERIEU|nr:golgin subfamily A member 2-like isoform X2 [Erinaceus europaeus]
MWKHPFPPPHKMSEVERQKSLARARKKLREFQERNNQIHTEATKKKKIKCANSSLDNSITTSEGCHPDVEEPKDQATPISATAVDLTALVSSTSTEIADLPSTKVADAGSPCLAADLVCTTKFPPSSDAELDAGSLRPASVMRLQVEAAGAPIPVADPAGDAAISPSSVSLSDAGGLESADIQPTQNPEVDGDMCPMINFDASMSSTESLRQLSLQLNGLVSEPSPLVNGDEVLSSADLKSLERQQNEDILNQREKEKKDFEQKFAKEQGALREQLQVHIQTIGILVSEKSDLQTALGHTQQAVRRKEGEAEELATKLHTSRLRVMELERTLSAAASRQKRAEKDNKELSQERDSLKMELYKNNKNNEDLKQLNSELEEKLRICVKEKATLQLGLDDVKKQLEMSELLLLQYSSPSEVATDNQQFQQALEVRTHLEKEVEQLKMLLKNLQIDRDNYAQRLNNETSFWQGKMQQLLDQMTTLKEEKEKSMNKVEELETYVTELKSQMAVPSPPEPPQGPSEMEQRLQTETEQLQKQLEDLAARLEEQVKNNNELNQLNLVQGYRLAELEREAEIWGDQAETRKKILETMENDRTTISRAMLQNQQLKEQLAELQDGFIKLTNDNVEITNALQSEQHVKKELANKMGVLQQDKEELKEMVNKKTQEAETLQEQRDQYLNHLQQYAAALQQHVAAYEQLAADRETLQKQLLVQTQLMDQLQHHSSEAKTEAEKAQEELQKTQDLLGIAHQQNEQLQAKLSLVTMPGVETDSEEEEELKEEGDEAPQAKLTMPEDLDSREAMVAFFNSALANAEKEQARLRRALRKQTRRCLRMAHLGTSTQTQREKDEVSTTGAEGNTITREAYQTLQRAMDKLQVRFTDLMNERVELKDRMEELEHRCIQLSGETDTIGEYITLYQNQRAVLKERHKEKEAYIHLLAQEKEEMKIKMLELQELILRLVADNKEKYSMALAAAQNCSGEPAPAAQNQELNTPGHSAASLVSNTGSTVTHMENTTETQIMQLLREIQKDPKECPGLGSNPCMPFFYKADENDQVKILVI